MNRVSTICAPPCLFSSRVLRGRRRRGGYDRANASRGFASLLTGTKFRKSGDRSIWFEEEPLPRRMGRWVSRFWLWYRVRITLFLVVIVKWKREQLFIMRLKIIYTYRKIHLFSGDHSSWSVSRVFLRKKKKKIRWRNRWRLDKKFMPSSLDLSTRSYVTITRRFHVSRWKSHTSVDLA